MRATNPVADLVMAMLAVNQWRLEQSAEICAGLEREGLFCPEKLAAMTHGDLHTALRNAGYRKAGFVIDLLCDRLFDMAHRLSGQGGEELAELCTRHDKDAVRAVVKDIKGVGPKVFENFWLLRESGVRGLE